MLCIEKMWCTMAYLVLWACEVAAQGLGDVTDLSKYMRAATGDNELLEPYMAREDRHKAQSWLTQDVLNTPRFPGRDLSHTRKAAELDLLKSLILDSKRMRDLSAQQPDYDSKRMRDLSAQQPDYDSIEAPLASYEKRAPYPEKSVMKMLHNVQIPSYWRYSGGVGKRQQVSVSRLAQLLNELKSTRALGGGEAGEAQGGVKLQSLRFGRK